MSPRTFLDEEPLVRLPEDQRQWIGDVLHRMWARRNDTKVVVAEAKDALETAHRRFLELEELMSAKPVGVDLDGQWSPQKMEALIAAAKRVHSAVSKLHSRVRVV